jgi:Tfp pilus assembly protein PilO
MNIHLSFAWRKRLSSPLTWHIVSVCVLLVVVIALGIRFGLDWTATNDHATNALASKQVELKTLEIENAPLSGLDKRVEDSRTKMRDFYMNRIPPSYSSIAMRIGELALKGPVRLSRVQYTQGAAGFDLTEISMDAGVTGDYSQIMRFVNGLERDQTFFVIRAMALTGQQGGMVSLRIRVSTWLRPADAAASGLPPTPTETVPAPATAPASGSASGSASGPAVHTTSSPTPRSTPGKEGF